MKQRGFRSVYIAIRQAKRDALCRTLGAFFIIQYEDGRFDYYPIGYWPTEPGTVLKAYTLCTGKWVGKNMKKGGDNGGLRKENQGTGALR